MRPMQHMELNLKQEQLQLRLNNPRNKLPHLHLPLLLLRHLQRMNRKVEKALTELYLLLLVYRHLCACGVVVLEVPSWTRIS